MLYGSDILGYAKQKMSKLQRIEKAVYRAILGASSYALIPTLRGEIGSSTMYTRIRGNQLKYLKYIEENESNDLLRRIIEEKLNTPKDYKIQTTKEFMKHTKIKHSDLKGMKAQKLKGKIIEWDTENWEKEVAERSSLNIYRKFKK